MDIMVASLSSSSSLPSLSVFDDHFCSPLDKRAVTSPIFLAYYWGWVSLLTQSLEQHLFHNISQYFDRVSPFHLLILQSSFFFLFIFFLLSFSFTSVKYSYFFYSSHISTFYPSVLNLTTSHLTDPLNHFSLSLSLSLSFTSKACHLLHTFQSTTHGLLFSCFLFITANFFQNILLMSHVSLCVW